MKDFTYDKNRCLNCYEELLPDWGSLFCPMCEPRPPVTGKKRKHVDLFDGSEVGLPAQSDLQVSAQQMETTEKTVGQLAAFESGYIRPGDLYFDTTCYRVAENSKIRETPDVEYCLNVVRSGDVLFADVATFDPRMARPFSFYVYEGVSMEVRIVDFDELL